MLGLVVNELSPAFFLSAIHLFPPILTLSETDLLTK